MSPKWIIGAVVAVVVVIAGGVGIGMFVGSQQEEQAQPAPSSGSPSVDFEEPNDDIAAEGGQGPKLTFTGWDAPIGRGGTLGGVMDPDLENRAVAAIEKDYRARHADAPEGLVGAIEDAAFDAGPQILTFNAVVGDDTYAARVETSTRAMRITGPDGNALPV